MRTGRLAALAAMAAMLALTTASVAAGAKPLATVPIDERLEGTWSVGDDPMAALHGAEPTIAGACQVETIETELVDTGFTQLLGDGFGDPGLVVVEHRRFDVTFTNPATGGSLTIEFRNTARYNPPVSESFHPETGILELQFVDDFRGLEYRLRAPGLGVIAMDAGHGTVGVAVVVDTKFTPNPEDDELVSIDFAVDQRGRFTWGGPAGGPDGAQLDLICRAMTGERGRGR